MNRQRRNLFVRVGLVLGALMLAGCSRAPSFDIAGSFFPAWLTCLMAAIVFTALAGWCLRRLQIPLLWPTLTYPSLTAFLTLALWLTFFGR